MEVICNNFDLTPGQISAFHHHLTEPEIQDAIMSKWNRGGSVRTKETRTPIPRSTDMAIHTLIGRGGFAEVYHVWYVHDGTEVVLKQPRPAGWATIKLWK